jgi:hypothetical protein
LPSKLQKYLPAESKSKAGEIFKSIVTAQKFRPGTVEREAINRSYRESQRILGIAGLAALVPTLFIMFLMKNVHLDEEETEQVEETAVQPAKVQ